MKMNTKKIIDPVYAHNYLVKEYSRLPRVDDAVIPLKLHLFWHNKQLPPKMHENVELLKSTNPEFEVVVYDGDMALKNICHLRQRARRRHSCLLFVAKDGLS